jgi:hypothetical protein
MKKKLFISCPMKGRTEENIRNSMERMHKMAELVFDQELDVIPSYIEHTPPKDNNQAVWYLGESIKKLSKADYFIGIDYGSGFKGCYIERAVAETYGIPSTAVRATDFCGDLVNES